MNLFLILLSCASDPMLGEWVLEAGPDFVNADISREYPFEDDEGYLISSGLVVWDDLSGHMKTRTINENISWESNGITWIQFEPVGDEEYVLIEKLYDHEWMNCFLDGRHLSCTSINYPEEQPYIYRK